MKTGTNIATVPPIKRRGICNVAVTARDVIELGHARAVGPFSESCQRFSSARASSTGMGAAARTRFTLRATLLQNHVQLMRMPNSD
jgi:hypothetical protein